VVHLVLASAGLEKPRAAISNPWIIVTLGATDVRVVIMGSATPSGGFLFAVHEARVGEQRINSPDAFDQFLPQCGRHGRSAGGAAKF
jgi:hypothetical protein